MSPSESLEGPAAALRDRLGRPLRSLRLSVTDRCNLRCDYCMPEEDYVWLPRRQLLDFDELDQVVGVFQALGVHQVRLTGGEPLLRRDLDRLVARIAARPGIDDLALTTNGILLGDQAADLRRAGLGRVTVSLDTLRPERFERLTRRDELPRVLEGIAAARRAGFEGTKLNTVVMRGTNDDELVDLVEFARQEGLEPRFIEYMDVGGATRWSASEVVPRDEILARLADRYGPPRPLPPSASDPSAPADRYELPDGLRLGIISSTTAPFCAACDRSRLTADGKWYLCLYARVGIDLAGPLRAGEAPELLALRIARAWTGREDRGAEERLRLAGRASLARPDELREDPHLEMHTRGG